MAQKLQVLHSNIHQQNKNFKKYPSYLNSLNLPIFYYFFLIVEELDFYRKIGRILHYNFKKKLKVSIRQKYKISKLILRKLYEFTGKIR